MPTCPPSPGPSWRWTVAGLKRLNEAIDALDTKIDGRLQLSIYASVHDLLHFRMVWFVRNVDFSAGIDDDVAGFAPASVRSPQGLIMPCLQDMQAGRGEHGETLTMAASRSNLPANFADLNALVSAPDIVTVAERINRAIGDTATTFFAADQFPSRPHHRRRTRCVGKRFFRTSRHRPRR